MLGDGAVADRQHDVDHPLAWQPRVEALSLDDLADHAPGSVQHHADLLLTRFRGCEAGHGVLPDQVVQVGMLTSQGKAYLEPLPNALPVRWSRPPDLLLGLAKEAVAHQKAGGVKPRPGGEILAKRLAADNEPTVS